MIIVNIRSIGIYDCMIDSSRPQGCAAFGAALNGGRGQGSSRAYGSCKPEPKGSSSPMKGRLVRTKVAYMWCYIDMSCTGVRVFVEYASSYRVTSTMAYRLLTALRLCMNNHSQVLKAGIWLRPSRNVISVALRYKMGLIVETTACSEWSKSFRVTPEPKRGLQLAFLVGPFLANRKARRL